MSGVCLVCGVAVYDAEVADVPGAPLSTVFTAQGNYGSGLFDPLPHRNEWLRINVCDPCLAEQATAGRVIHAQGQHVAMPDPEYTTWIPT